MDKKAQVEQLTTYMANFVSYIGKVLPDDIKAKIDELAEKEDSPLSKVIYQTMQKNQVLAKELTKRFETFKRSMLHELLDDLETETPRREYVILVGGWNEIAAEEKEQKTGWREEAVSFALKMPLKEAARQVSFKHHLSRREVYQYLLNQKEADANK